MDKELEQNVKDLERGYELKQEEAMHGERVGQTLEMNEELEDKLELVKKLKKKLKLTRGTSIGVFAVLILVLLYACVTYIMHPSQTVMEKTITYNLEVPELGMSQMESVTLDEIMRTFDDPRDEMVCCYGNFNIGDEYPSGAVFYPLASTEDAFYGSKRSYSVNTGVLTCEEHNTDRFKDCSTAYYYDSNGNLTSRVTYYNEELFKSGWGDMINSPNHREHINQTINIRFYNEIDIDVASMVKDVLENYPLAEITREYIEYDNGTAEIRLYRDYNINPEKFTEDIRARLPEVDFSVEMGDFFFSTYDSVEEQEEYTVCFRNGKKYIPKVVTDYNIEITDYDFDVLSCMAQEYEGIVQEQAEEPEYIVHNETLTFVMEVPELDMSQVKSITLDELMGTLSTRKDKVVYLGKAYKQDDEYPSGVILYSAETVEKAFASAKRIYTLNGEIMECTHHPQGILPGCFVRRYLDADISSSSSYVYYYNDAVLRENTLFESWEVSDVPNHYGHREWGIKLEIYGKTDVDVSSLIKNTLESLPFARFLPTSDGYAANDMADHYRFGVDPKIVAKSIINGLSDVEFSLEVESPSQEYEDYFYSTDGIESTEAVTNYNIKVVDYDYKSWICGVQEYWFE